MTFAYIDICFSLLPIVFFLIYWTKSKSENSIWYIVIYSLLFFIINSLLLIWRQIPLLYDFNTFFEYWLFSAFFLSQLQSTFSKRLLRFSNIVYTVFYIAFIIYTKSANDTTSIPMNTVEIDSIPIGVETILILPFAFYFLYERTRDTTTLFIYNTYQFWIVLGIVLYLAGSFFIYIFTNYLSPAEVVKYWVITNIFSVIRSCFFVLGIIYHAKPPKNNTLMVDFEVGYLN